MAGDQFIQGITRRREFVFVLEFFRNQSFQRIHGVQGVQVQHQAVLKAGLRRLYRLQVEHLRFHRLAQIHHQAHGGRCELTDAHTADERVVAAHFADEFAQFGIQFNAFNVNRQSRRLADHGVAGDQGGVGLNGDAGVVIGRPDPHAQYGGTTGQLSATQQQHQRAGL